MKIGVFRLTIRRWMILIVFVAIMAGAFVASMRGRPMNVESVLTSLFAPAWLVSPAIFVLLFLMLERPGRIKGWLAIQIMAWMTIIALGSFFLLMDAQYWILRGNNLLSAHLVRIFSELLLS